METKEEINAAINLVREGDAEFADIMLLANATIDSEAGDGPAPQVLVDAINGVYVSERDFDNGGPDQFVWNHGVETARLFGEAWCEVGAVENGELLLGLADILEAYNQEFSDAVIQEDITRHFLAFRGRCGMAWQQGDIKEELHEAIVEWSIENIDSFLKR